MGGISPGAQVSELSLDTDISPEPANIRDGGPQMSGHSDIQLPTGDAELAPGRDGPKAGPVGLKRWSVAESGEKTDSIGAEELKTKVGHNGVPII